MNGGLAPFANPAWWLAGAHLAEVVSLEDPQHRGRVQVQLHGPDPKGDAAVWARVAVPFAGNNYGAFLLPDVGEEVLVVFAGADARHPVVVGALWTGAHDLPEELSAKQVDRWTLTGKNGTRIAIVEKAKGKEQVVIETPGGATATLSDADGGEISLVVGGNSLTMDSAGIAIEAGGEFSVQASTIRLEAGSMTVTAAAADFSGATSSASLRTGSVISASYSPGAGNIW